jgi:hypothetical protein
MDPRVRTPQLELQAQRDLVMRLYDRINDAGDALAGIQALRAQLIDRRTKAPQVADAVQPLMSRLDALDGGSPAAGRGGRGGGAGGAGGRSTLGALRAELTTLFNVVEEVDRAPGTSVSRAATDRLSRAASLLSEWRRLQGEPLSEVNAKLRTAGLEPIAIAR